MSDRPTSPQPNRPRSPGPNEPQPRTRPPGPGASPPGPAAGAGDPNAPTREQLKSALKAFKKRLKLARLDDDSRLGHGAMSSGGRSGIVSIMPPAQFPPAVWEELVRQGKLRKSGYGMYELASEL